MKRIKVQHKQLEKYVVIITLACLITQILLVVSATAQVAKPINRSLSVEKSVSNMLNGGSTVLSRDDNIGRVYITAPTEIYDKSVLTIIIDYEGPEPFMDVLITLTKTLDNMTHEIWKEALYTCSGYSFRIITKHYVSGVKWVNGTVTLDPYGTPEEKHFSVKVLPNKPATNLAFPIILFSAGVIAIVSTVMYAVRPSFIFARGEKK